MKSLSKKPSPSTIRVVVKAPSEPAVETDIESSLEALQAAVGGYIELYRHPAMIGVDVWINEEGKIKGLPENIQVPGDVIRGTVVFARTGSHGKTVSLRKEDIQKVLAWCALRGL